MSLIALFSILAAAALILPVLSVLVLGSPAQIASLISEPGIQKALWTTVWMSAATGLGCCVIGLSAGWLFSRREWPFKSFYRFAFCVPYLVPNFIWAMAYTLTWNPTTGVFNKALALFGLGPWSCYGFWGMTFVMILTHFPVAFLVLEERFSKFDASLEEAARISGCTPFQTFYKVVLPQLWAPIVSSFVLVFTLSLSAFGIPAWLGVPARQHVLTTKLFERLQAGGGAEGLQEAAALGAILAALGILLLVAEILLRRVTTVKTLAAKSPRKISSELSLVMKFVTLIGFAAVFFVTWVGPLLAIFVLTLFPPGALSNLETLNFSEMSFSRYVYVTTELQDTKQALVGSFGYGALAVGIILLLSAIFILASRKYPKLRSINEAGMSLPLASAGAVIALGLIILTGGKWGFVLTNTPWIVVAAFVVKHCALCYGPLQSALVQVSDTYIEAARISGCSPFQSFIKIVLPMLLPSILAASLLAYIPILGELSMSVFLVGPNIKTIGSVLYELHDYADQPASFALAIVLVLSIITINFLVRILSRGRLGF